MCDDYLTTLGQIFRDYDSPAGIIYFFILGSFWGSFLNVCIYRLPYGRSIVYPGSSCPRCGQPIEWWQNLPILSFVIIKAKCYYCHARISFRYPLIELTTAVISGFLFHFCKGFGWDFIYSFIFSNLLIIVFFIDLDHWLILDNVIMPGIVFGLLGSLWILPRDTTGLDFSPLVRHLPLAFLHWDNLCDSLAGMVAGYFFFAVIALMGSITLRQEAMGGGDIKFAALIGAFLGCKGSIIAFMASFFLGFLYALPLLLIRRKKGKDPVPFGTFMALAAFMTLVWQEKLLWLFLNWQMLFFKIDPWS
jgi:leader peptidase (prepilin peptidase) / N-methyltransferase